jgi:plastocyanin
MKGGSMRALSRWLALLALIPALSCVADATGLTIQVDDDQGHAVGDAVVTVLPEDTSVKLTPKRALESTTKIIDQKDETFIPYVQVFRPGDKVLFRNSDQMRHHVYTFSPIKPFEFVLVPGDSSKPIELDQTGVIAVGCNIHDQMITYLYISDAPWIAQSGADGKVEFGDIPAGQWNVRVWHPRLRPGKPDLAQSTTTVTTGEPKVLSFRLSLLPDSRRDFDREHTRY